MGLKWHQDKATAIEVAETEADKIEAGGIKVAVDPYPARIGGRRKAVPHLCPGAPTDPTRLSRKPGVGTTLDSSFPAGRSAVLG